MRGGGDGTYPGILSTCLRKSGAPKLDLNISLSDQSLPKGGHCKTLLDDLSIYYAGDSARRSPLGLVEITITIGVPMSIRCRRKMLRLVLRRGSTSALSDLGVKNSGANTGVTRSSLYLPGDATFVLEPGLLKLP